MIATPVWDTLAAEHERLADDYTVTRHGADLALWPHGTWREQTRTHAPSRAMDRVSRALLGGA